MMMNDEADRHDAAERTRTYAADPERRTFLEREVFAFLDSLRANGEPPPYSSRVVAMFGLSGQRAFALCAKWNEGSRERQ